MSEYVPGYRVLAPNYDEESCAPAHALPSRDDRISAKCATERLRTMRIAIIGSREYPSLNAVRQFVWECERTTVIVSGGA